MTLKSGERAFKIVAPEQYMGGRFESKSAYGAARKAATSIFKEMKKDKDLLKKFNSYAAMEAFTFSIIEITKSKPKDKKKTYTYAATPVKLKPVEVKGSKALKGIKFQQRMDIVAVKE